MKIRAALACATVVFLVRAAVCAEMEIRSVLKDGRVQTLRASVVSAADETGRRRTRIVFTHPPVTDGLEVMLEQSADGKRTARLIDRPTGESETVSGARLREGFADTLFSYEDLMDILIRPGTTAAGASRTKTRPDGARAQLILTGANPAVPGDTPEHEGRTGSGTNGTFIAGVPSPPREPIWSKLDLHGYCRVRNLLDRTRDHAAEDTHELRSSLRIEGAYPLRKVRLFASLDGQLDYASDGNDWLDCREDDLRVWECYASAFLGRLNLQAGKQTIRWGKGDEVNPTDNFTPENFSEFLNLDRAERKMPAWMAKAIYVFSPYRVEAVWLPFFEPNRLPGTGSDWEPYAYQALRGGPVPFQLQRREVPDGLESQVAAVRLTHSTAGYDLSLSCAYHYDQLPTLQADLNTLAVSQTYPRQRTIGCDFETTAGIFTIRTEASYTFGDQFYSKTRPDVIHEENALAVITGADCTYRGTYYNLQYFFSYVPSRDSDMVTHRYEDSMLLRISRDCLRNRLLLEARAWVFLYNPSMYYRLQATYDVTDALKVGFGYDYYDGDKDETLGQFRHNDQYYVSVVYSF